MSLNKVMLIGNVGGEPKIIEFESGRMATFSLATNKSWKDKESGEWKNKTEWHKIVANSQNLINLIEKYLIKGMKLYVEGEIQTRKWIDKEGKDSYSTEIMLNNFSGKIEILDNKKSENLSNDEVDNQNLDDNIPF
jgi:single-strand DNA-binding protein